MFINGPLLLERRGNSAVLHSTNNAWWLGLLFAAIGITCVNYFATAPNDDPTGILVGSIFVAVGAFFALPREVETEFDLRNRRVLYTLSLCHGWYQKRRAYSFDEIAGLGVREYSGSEGGGYTYMPIMTLQDGQRHWLSTANGSFLAYAEVLDAVRAATKLPKYDVLSLQNPMRWTSKS